MRRHDNYFDGELPKGTVKGDWRGQLGTLMIEGERERTEGERGGAGWRKRERAKGRGNEVGT